MINLRKFAWIGLAGIIAASSLVTVFAAEINNNQSDNNKSFRKGGFVQLSNSYKSAMDQLVTAGTITQDQEDAVLASFSGKGDKDGQRNQDGKKQSPWDSLVTAGTITQEQADAIESAMKTARESKDSKQSAKDILDSLVSAGTLTQNQENAITAAMPGKGDKDGQRNQDGKKQSPWDSLVTAGTITQEQADAIESAMKTARESKDSKQSAKDILESLVSAGTLTQDQENAITAAMPGKGDKGESRGPGKMLENKLSSLVSAGTITQEQSDAIVNSIKEVNQSAKAANESTDK